MLVNEMNYLSKFKLSGCKGLQATARPSPLRKKNYIVLLAKKGLLVKIVFNKQNYTSVHMYLMASKISLISPLFSSPCPCELLPSIDVQGFFINFFNKSSLKLQDQSPYVAVNKSLGNQYILYTQFLLFFFVNKHGPNA